MRTARLRPNRKEGSYLHLYQRACGFRSDRIFGDVERQFMLNLIGKVSALYTLEIIAVTAMSNHVHIVAFVPGEPPTPEETCRRYNAFYAGMKPELIVNSPDLARIQKRLGDFSVFMGHWQQSFTCWFNRTRKEQRRGRLWGDRFKHTILEGREALWTCVQYVEMNPVRAGICEQPDDYRFCSWGIRCGSGKHPYATNFLHHLRRSLGDRADDWSMPDLEAEFRSDLARKLTAELGASGEEIAAASDLARAKVPVTLQLTRRARYWTDGAVIGSRQFVMEITAEALGAERAKKRRYGRGLIADGTALFSMRQLRTVAPGSDQDLG